MARAESTFHYNEAGGEICSKTQNQEVSCRSELRWNMIGPGVAIHTSVESSLVTERTGCGNDLLLIPSGKVCDSSPEIS